jgi:hypothetical protein
MTSLLSVPYIGQVGFGSDEHGNDCGAASAAMLIKFAGVNCPIVDVLYNEVRLSGNNYLSIGDLMALLSHRNIKSEWFANTATKDLFWVLVQGTPVIALIRYGALETIRPNTFKGSHFIVVVGMDLDTVYIHDPLNTPTTGERIALPMAMFEAAWSTVGDDNPQRSMIVPAKGAAIPVIAPAILRVVYPKDKDGCNVRSVPGDTSDKTKLRAIPFGTSSASKMNIYFERDGWGKIHPTKEEWVSLAYVK